MLQRGRNRNLFPSRKKTPKLTASAIFLLLNLHPTVYLPHLNMIPGVRGNILCIIAELVDGGVMMRDESIQFIQRGAQNRLVDF
jgi:hypothetical protein